MGTNASAVVVLLLIGLVVLYLIVGCKLACGSKEPYGAPNYYCRWDSRRFCTLPNGDPGKCVMNGLCVPPMLMLDAPPPDGPLSSPGESPVSPTWRWRVADDPSLDSLNPLADILARETRNDYSSADVMDYVDLKAATREERGD